MTPEQIQSVKKSFALVRPISNQAGMLFYGRLFELDPSLRAMFAEDITEQSRKLMQMIGTVVANLDKLQAIVPAVQELGARHKGYGVTDRHYETVAAALLWTLKEGLGSAFTPEVEGAWTSAYVILADTMKAAAKASVLQT